MSVATKKSALPVLASANLFELAHRQARLTYTVSNIAGQPLLQFDNAGVVRNFSGDEIRRTRTELGTEVTVDLKVIADGPTNRLTLIVPEVLVGPGRSEDLITPVIFHTEEGSLIGHPVNPGPVQTYSVKLFSGEASRVDS